MNAAATITDSAPYVPHGAAQMCAPTAEALRAGQLAVLQELSEIGMQIARAVRDEVLAPAPAADEPAPPSRFGRADPAIMFSRIAKAVRQTLLLQTRVFEGVEKAKEVETRRKRDVQQLILDQRQEDVRGFVADAIENEVERGDRPEKDAERLLEELDERLEDGCYDDRLADAPIPELITRICCDLGVSPDWRIWGHLDWGAEFLREYMGSDPGAERYPPPGAAKPPKDPDPDTG